MMQFSCDRCQRMIHSDIEFRYFVKIETIAALDVPYDAETDVDQLHDGERDHPALLGEERERNDAHAFHKLRFDLCPECYGKFIQSPVGSDALRDFHFSQN